MFQILVIEDDKDLRQLICTVLKKNQFLTLEATDGKEALKLLEGHYVDLIITDIMMPHLDGYTFIQMLRDAKYNMPIIIITAKDTFEDKKKGFMAGTDDYMVKPIDLNEMMLRIHSLFRRAQIATEHKLHIGNIVLEYDTLSIVHNGSAHALPQKEFYLLYKLFSSQNKIFTRQQLMDEIWGMDSESDERTVDVHVNRLRERLKAFNELQIQTIRGLGYKGVRGPS